MIDRLADRSVTVQALLIEARSLRRVKIRSSHGFALIDMIFVCGIVGLLCGIALPKLLLARQSAGAASAIGSMRAINSAELTFALTCGSGFYAPDLPTLGTPPPGSNEPFISPDLGSAGATAQKSGYIIRLEGTPYAGAPGTCNGLGVGDAAQGFKAAADSVEPSNLRFFATNASGTIYEDTASLWGSIPEVDAPPTGTPLH
jgi:type II secretory pathway pseudopilin PulG